MATQHHSTRKMNLRLLREVLPTLTINDVEITSEYGSKQIKYLFGTYDDHGFYVEISFILSNFMSPETEKYGRLGAIGISLERGSDEGCRSGFALGLPNQAFDIVQPFHIYSKGVWVISSKAMWDIKKYDTLLDVVFEDNFLGEFLSKAMEFMKNKHSRIRNEYKNVLTEYPVKACPLFLETKKSELDVITLEMLIETVKCLRMIYKPK